MLIAALVLLGTLYVATSAEAQTAPAQTSVELISKSSNAFSFDFYQKIAADPANAGKNLFFSPYSIAAALSMIVEGAKGQTAAQLIAALHLPADPVLLHDGAAGIRKKFAESSADQGFQLFTANGLWIDQVFSPAVAFIKSLEEVYGTKGPATLDFKGNPYAARKQINAWGEEQTRGKIKEVITGEFPPETSMVLANTVYFKATWFKQFQSTSTKTKPFHIHANPANDLQVSMMEQWTDDANLYFENEDLKVTQLKYGYWKSNPSSYTPVIPAFMLLILPKRIDKLTEVESAFSQETLCKILTSMEPASVHIQLPKFRTSSQFDLKKTLGGLHVTDLFASTRCDLSGISSKAAASPLFVSSATHRAVIEVNEEGTEAAADTLLIASGGGPPKRAEFIADHPFLFYIIHRETNAILFMGRVVNPLSGE